jgi:response regulator RpfG family c-di-GMP phosphodiesterase
VVAAGDFGKPRPAVILQGDALNQANHNLAETNLKLAQANEQLEHANHKLEKANHDLLKVLVKAIETRDPYTSGHSLRVSMLSRMIGADIGLPPAVLTQVENAALLHDIGKIDARFAPIIS